MTCGGSKMWTTKYLNFDRIDWNEIFVLGPLRKDIIEGHEYLVLTFENDARALILTKALYEQLKPELGRNPLIEEFFADSDNVKRAALMAIRKEGKLH